MTRAKTQAAAIAVVLGALVLRGCNGKQSEEAATTIEPARSPIGGAPGSDLGQRACDLVDGALARVRAAAEHANANGASQGAASPTRPGDMWSAPEQESLQQAAALLRDAAELDPHWRIRLLTVELAHALFDNGTTRPDFDEAISLLDERC